MGRRILQEGPRRGIDPRELPQTFRPPRAWLLLACVVMVAAALLTSIALQGGAGTTDGPPTTSPTAGPTSTDSGTPPAASPSSPRAESDPKPAQSPTGRAPAATIPSSGPNTYVVTRQTTGPTSNRGRLVRVSVAIETGLPLSSDQVGLQIMSTLSDRRSWGARGAVRFQLIADPHAADLVVYVTTPRTTDRLCAPLKTHGELSCQQHKRVVLNAARWVAGSPTYGTNLSAYRDYLVNHEVGHYLGHGHVNCKRPGATANVMVQQSKSLAGCKANPWPYP